MQNDFIELGISPAILKAIEEMGFVEPTEVQSQAIPTILNHQDVIVMSKTGSGKTAVFGVPMLQMTDPDEDGPQGLILTPTRELAVQVDEDLKLMSKYLEHKTAVVYGQHSMNVEVQSLKKGVSIVTGTPGRVFDHLRQGNLVTKHIRFLVLDEADRMLDMGFLNQVVRIIKALPRNRVTLLFSATIPTEIQRISKEFMNNPVMIEIESQTMTVDSIRQIYYRLNRNEKQTQLNRLLLIEQPESCMIFCNTRIAVDHVQNFLTRKGYSAQSLHGDIPQARRMKTIEQFKQGVFHILVATDVAARGIHIDSLSLVINYDVPLEKDGYVHRIGRTGRAGNEGLAITLVTSDDIMSLYAIEEHTGAMIEEAELPTDDMLNELKESSDNWIKANSNLLPNISAPSPSRASANSTRTGNTRNSKSSSSRIPGSSSNQNSLSKPTNASISNRSNDKIGISNTANRKVSTDAGANKNSNPGASSISNPNSRTSSNSSLKSSPKTSSSPISKINSNENPESGANNIKRPQNGPHFRTFGGTQEDANTQSPLKQTRPATTEKPITKTTNNQNAKSPAKPMVKPTTTTTTDLKNNKSTMPNDKKKSLVVKFIDRIFRK